MVKFIWNLPINIYELYRIYSINMKTICKLMLLVKHITVSALSGDHPSKNSLADFCTSTLPKALKRRGRAFSCAEVQINFHMVSTEAHLKTLQKHLMQNFG